MSSFLPLMATSLGGQGFPTTVLLDRQGRPRERVQGEGDWTGAAATQWAEPLLKK